MSLSRLADKTVFQSECKDVLGRMLEVVPKGVTFSDEITLLPAKVTAAQLTFEQNQMVFKTNFRVCVLPLYIKLQWDWFLRS